MTVIQIETQLSLEDLLHSLKQLSSADLEQVLQQVATLKAQQRATEQEQQESKLLQTINRHLTPQQQTRIDFLIESRQQETLSPSDLGELMALTDLVEQIQIERLEALIELAALRNQTIDELMQVLELA